ncbi:hypothetical protein MtrunA17_Chr7g0229161 [Medicago truncatula]|uniref:Uncharacterized protein n=1 Tax=Medicago truncatula TaxID=3880 RepID=A0A396GW01_MEDTR|nr:hypothetical protein MtrunA17_Chr7g0229161 [Medicago truncatula]
MGIPVYISEDATAFVIRRAFEGSFKGVIENSKTSPWNEVVHKSMFNITKKGAYCDLSMEKKMLLKIQNENLLSKGGGSDQPSLEHKIFIHFFITKEKANVPRYIFKHMIKERRESQDNNSCWVPYRRLISDQILHQGWIMKALKNINFFTDDQLDTKTEKVINGKTLRNMYLIPKDAYTKLSADLKESDAMSILMEEFPPICKQDPLDVQINFIKDHFATPGTKIRLEYVPETVYGGALLVSNRRKTKRKSLTKEEYLGDAPEQPAKKANRAKKERVAVQENIVGPAILTIQKEVEDLEADKILPKRIRSGKSAASSQYVPGQPSIPKKKRRKAIRKLKVADYVMKKRIRLELQLIL